MDFNRILLCADLDDTLLSKDKSVCARNIEAIERFTKNGGLFTFATGRVPLGVVPVYKYIKPNAPMICFNGAGIYDAERKKSLWSLTLPRSAVEVVDFVNGKYPFSGIEVCTAERVFFCRENRRTREHKLNELFPDNKASYRDIAEEWVKVIFIQEDYELDTVRNGILAEGFSSGYELVRSSPYYYELLPKGASKGNGLLRLAQLLGIPISRTIACGDNENDISLMESAGISIAAGNACESVKKAADFTVCGCNDGVIADAVDMLESGKIELNITD